MDASGGTKPCAWREGCSYRFAYQLCQRCWGAFARCLGFEKIFKKKKVDDEKRLIVEDLVIPLDDVRVQYRCVPVYYMYIETGFIDSVTIIPVMKCFMDVWKIWHGVNNDLSTPSSTYCWVLSYRLGVHRSPVLLEMMIVNHFEPWSLPRDITYFSSPLDLTPHAALKKLESQLAGRVAEASIRIHQEYKQLLMTIATEALKESFRPECIKKSFSESCIWPWRKNDRARNYLSAVYDRDIASMGVEASSVKRMMTIEEQADRHLLESVTQRVIKIPVVEKNLLFNGRDVLAASRKRKLAMKEKADAKLKKQKVKEELNCGHYPKKKWKKLDVEKRTCCGTNCGVSWRGSRDWRVCECGKLYICPQCRKKVELATDFIEHCKSD